MKPKYSELTNTTHSSHQHSRKSSPLKKEMIFREVGTNLVKQGQGGWSLHLHPLSEAEERKLFQFIEECSSNPISRLRDIAMFTTAIQTTMRLGSLNSMRIENFRELDPGVWICRVRVTVIKKRNEPEIPATDEDELQEWYMSPRAVALIDQYLQVTGRDWNSEGSVWLTHDGRPLSLNNQRAVIREWLRKAGCKSTQISVLRHTGIDRLLNTHKLYLPMVRAITQHTDFNILLQSLGRTTRMDAFKMVNEFFPVATNPELERND